MNDKTRGIKKWLQLLRLNIIELRIKFILMFQKKPEYKAGDVANLYSEGIIYRVKIIRYIGKRKYSLQLDIYDKRFEYYKAYGKESGIKDLLILI